MMAEVTSKDFICEPIVGNGLRLSSKRYRRKVEHLFAPNFQALFDPEFFSHGFGRQGILAGNIFVA